MLDENWVRFYSQESGSQNDDVEALSLCDLATNEHDDTEENHSEQRLCSEPEADFDFGSGGGGSTQPENNMCSADELFFRGQILPLRHSVTLPSRFMTRTEEFTRSISFSRSEPVSVASSRSSSSRSSTSVSEFNGYRPAVTTRNQNQFYSYPSPAPQIRTRTFRHSNKSPSKWSFLQLGPLKPQEIGLADLKNRSQRSHGRGNTMQHEDDKKKQILSFSGCKCSADVIESAVSSRISMVKPTTLNEEQTGFCVWKQSNVGRRKHVVSGHRTSEWLKQLLVQKNDLL